MNPGHAGEGVAAGVHARVQERRRATPKPSKHASRSGLAGSNVNREALLRWCPGAALARARLLGGEFLTHLRHGYCGPWCRLNVRKGRRAPALSDVFLTTIILDGTMFSAGVFPVGRL